MYSHHVLCVSWKGWGWGSIFLRNIASLRHSLCIIGHDESLGLLCPLYNVWFHDPLLEVYIGGHDAMSRTLPVIPVLNYIN